MIPPLVFPGMSLGKGFSRQECFLPILDKAGKTCKVQTVIYAVTELRKSFLNITSLPATILWQCILCF
jgi:hypothetical protein